MRIDVLPTISDGTIDKFFFSNTGIGSIPGISQVFNIVEIPAFQREYTWSNDDCKNIKQLLFDLKAHDDHQSSISSVSARRNGYFAGAIVVLVDPNGIPKTQKIEVIDGQQRLTTAYLLTFLGFELAKFLFEKVPSGPFAQGAQGRHWVECINYENRIFTNIPQTSIYQGDKTTFLERLATDVQNTTDPAYFTTTALREVGIHAHPPYWASVRPRFRATDPAVESAILSIFKSIRITDLNGIPVISGNINRNNDLESRYFDAIQVMHDTILELAVTTGLSTVVSPAYTAAEQMLKFVNQSLHDIGTTVLFSYSVDDAFMLFEILNDRGEDLTPIDLIKNYILKNMTASNTVPSDFSQQWKAFKEILRDGYKGKKRIDASFAVDVIMSEGIEEKDEPVSYLTNKKSNRPSIYSNESSLDFLSRLIKFAHRKSFIKANVARPVIFGGTGGVTLFSFEHCLNLIRYIDYEWGEALLLGVEPLLQKYAIPLSAANTKPIYWMTQTPPNPTQQLNTLNNHDFVLAYLQELAISVLKLGVTGLVGGQQKQNLPKASRQVLTAIINHCDSTNQSGFAQTISQLRMSTLTTIKNELDLWRADFIRRILDLRADKARDKKLTMIIHFILMNIDKAPLSFGNGTHWHQQSVINFNRQSPIWFADVELEHIEPKNPQPSAPQRYFSHIDRATIIEQIGNTCLLDKYINGSGSWGNLPVGDQTTRLTAADLANLAYRDTSCDKISTLQWLAKSVHSHASRLYQNDLFRHLSENRFQNNGQKIKYIEYEFDDFQANYDSQTLQIDPQGLPVFTATGAPTELFFRLRGRMISKMAANFFTYI